MKKMKWLFTCAIWLIWILGGMGCQGTAETPSSEGGDKMTGTITLTSSAFSEGKDIPRQYTCDGQDISPPLAWSGIPDGTQSLALIADDPDAPMGTWVHWVLFDIPSDRTDLPQGVPKTNQPAGIGTQGITDFRRIGYGGPCPPPGKPHRYFFKLYALDTTVNLQPGASKADLERAMQNHVLAQGQLMGTYAR